MSLKLQEYGRRLIELYKWTPLSFFKEIYDGLKNPSYSCLTMKRTLSKLAEKEFILIVGKGKGTKYQISPSYELLGDIDMERYFSREQDERQIKNEFNFSLIPIVLSNTPLFTEQEIKELETLQIKFKSNVAHLSKRVYDKEMERLAIDLSWKSSQIEGNTYSLLETERLFKELQTAKGKPKEDATMLLNHKKAINFILDNVDYVVPLTVRGIGDIHSLLTEGAGCRSQYTVERGRYYGYKLQAA